MSDPIIETKTGLYEAETVMVRLGGIRIELSTADYRAMLAGIRTDLAALHAKAHAREQKSLQRLIEMQAAARELRAIVYEECGDFCLLRDKPDGAALDQWVEKYSGAMGL